jgi:mediator of RNA polymerase II transcription subunit 16
MAWLIDTLLELPKNLPPTVDLTSPTMSLPNLLAHLHTTNTISLHFLLSSSARGFLTAICRRLLHLDYIARRAIMIGGPNGGSNSTQAGGSGNANGNSNSNSSGAGANANGSAPLSVSPALRAAYMQIATITQSSVMRIKTMETLLSSLTSLIKTAYSSHVPSLSGNAGAEKARNALEIKMLFGGSFPDAFRSVIVELYRREGLLENVREDIEPAKLFFADFTALEVEEERGAVERRRKMGKTMDCFRKGWLINPASASASASASTTLSSGDGHSTSAAAAAAAAAVVVNTTSITLGGTGRQGARWRRCARCASVMEEVLTNRQALQWMVMQQRRCFCSGYWDTLAPGEKVA